MSIKVLLRYLDGLITPELKFRLIHFLEFLNY